MIHWTLVAPILGMFLAVISMTFYNHHCSSSYGHYSIMKLDNGRPSKVLMDLKPSNLTPEETRRNPQVSFQRFI